MGRTFVDDDVAGLDTGALTPSASIDASYLHYPPINQILTAISVDKQWAAPHPFANSVYLMPFVIPKGRVASFFRINVDTLEAGKTFTAMVYADDGGAAGKLLSLSASGSLAATGIQSASFASGSGSWKSNGRMVWAGFWCDATTARIKAWDVGATGNNDGELTGVLPILGVNVSYNPVATGWVVSGGTYSAGTAPTADVTTISGLADPIRCSITTA